MNALKTLPLLIASLLSCQPAFAEDGLISDASEKPADVSGAGGDWKFALGGGIASTPRYEGSSRNRLRFAPLIEVEHGRFFAGAARGIGYNMSDDKDIQYGPRLTLAPYRRQSADRHLHGMGDIGYGGEIGGFVNARFAPWYVMSGIAAGSNGSRLELDGGYEARLSQEDRIRAGLELNWADNKYMQTYFGVSAAQSTASGGVLAPFNAGSGIRNYGLKINWTHAYSKEWFSNAGISYKQLSGSAANSPLTMRRSMSTVSFVVGYRF